MNYPKQKYKELELDSIMPFGKHKGERIQSILDEEEDYITWLLENTSVKFSSEALIEFKLYGLPITL